MDHINMEEVTIVEPGMPPTWYTYPEVSKSNAPQGVKFDNGKLRYDLIPPEALEGIARVLAFGANKYSARNWEKGMSWGRVFASLMRHAWAWWRGENKDPETGFSHLDHLICNAAFLLTYEKRGIGTDDRSS